MCPAAPMCPWARHSTPAGVCFTTLMSCFLLQVSIAKTHQYLLKFWSNDKAVLFLSKLRFQTWKTKVWFSALGFTVSHRLQKELQSSISCVAVKSFAVKFTTHIRHFSWHLFAPVIIFDSFCLMFFLRQLKLVETPLQNHFVYSHIHTAFELFCRGLGYSISFFEQFGLYYWSLHGKIYSWAVLSDGSLFYIAMCFQSEAVCNFQKTECESTYRPLRVAPDWTEPTDHLLLRLK